jgi:hypothetical protein
MKGVRRSPQTEFKAGQPSCNTVPVGTVSVRTFTRTKDQRAFVKVAEPNVWRLRAHVVWEAANGPLPRGACVHHKDRDKLNDDLGNLEVLTVAEHLAEHRAEFGDRCIAALVAARKARRWSTKSATKRCGRAPTYTEDAMRLALAAVAEGATLRAASAQHGVPVSAIRSRRAAHVPSTRTATAAHRRR